MLAAIAFTACILAGLHGRGELPLVWQTRPLRNVQHEQKHAYIAHLGTGAWNSMTWPSVAQLLEDGCPIGSGNILHDHIREDGSGLYSFWDSYILFSTSDNSDPKTNGRLYEVRGPYPIPRRLLITLVGMAFVLTVLAVSLSGFRAAQGSHVLKGKWVSRAGNGLRKVFGNAPFARAAIVFCCTLLIQVFNYLVHLRDPALARFGLNILGVPFSDAMGWDTLGKSIAAGHGMMVGWEAIRPFYGIFLALFYTWTDGSFALAVPLNLVLTALTATLLFRCSEAMFDWRAGAVAALAFCLNTLTRAYSLTIATETLGLFLLVATLYLLVIGLRDGRGWMLVGAGACLGLSNLARPLTIFAFPAYLLCALVFGWRAASLRRGVTWMVLLSLGLAVTLGPWLVRQRYLNGITTISYNSADAFYCATTPRYGGSWSSELYADVPTELTTIKDRYNWFMNRAFENIRTNPSYYVTNVARAFAGVTVDAGRTYLGPTLLGTWLLILLTLLRNPPASRIGGLLAGLAACVLFALTERYLPPQVKLYASISGLLLAGWLGRGGLGLLLSVTTAFSIFGIAMFGMAHPDLRLLLLIEWGFLLGYFALLYYVFSWCIGFAGAGWGSWRSRGSDFHADSSTNTTLASPVWFKGLCALTALFLLISALRLTYLNLTADVPQAAFQPYQRERAREIAENLARRYPSVLSLHSGSGFQVAASFDEAVPAVLGVGRVFAVPGRLTSYVFRLPDGLVFESWCRHFRRRTYDRTIAYVQLAGVPYPKHGPFCYPVTISGFIPERFVGCDCTVIGYVTRDEVDPAQPLSWEGIAIIPHDPVTGEPIYEEAYLGDDPRHLSLLRPRVDSSETGGAAEGAASPTLTESHD
jgi:hypothetical protein